MEFTAVHVWIVLGIGMLIGEIFTPAFVLACLGIGALVASVAAWLEAGITTQIFVFSVGSVVSVFAVRPLLVRFFAGKSRSLKTGVAALVGKIGVVEKAIEAPGFCGEVRVGGESWRAEAKDPMEAGARVKVTGVSGVTLFVEEDA